MRLAAKVTNMMKYVFVLVSCIAVSAHAQNEMHAPMPVTDLSPTFLTALKATAGDDALACGAVDFNAARSVAFECAKSALNGGKPFWLALRVDSSDINKWSSASRNKSGTLFLVESNTELGKSPNKTSTLSTKITKCSWFKFQSNESQPIVCLRPHN